MATEQHVAPHAGAALPEPLAGRGSKISQGMLVMILFIGSEVMLFASFFAAYFFVRYNVAENAWPPLNSNGEPFELPKALTGVNTLFLVFSSFTVWWAEHCLKHGDRKGLARGLVVTILLGSTFLVIQVIEYAHLGFTPQNQAFGATFYSLTGLHGFHVFVGLTLLTICLVRVVRANDFTPTWATPLGAASIYWHFVDVVWVLLYFLVYLL
jgi:cytochrome c oxidase subunit III